MGASGIKHYDLRAPWLFELVLFVGDAPGSADKVGVEVANEHKAKVILNVNALLFIPSRIRC